MFVFRHGSRRIAALASINRSTLPERVSGKRAYASTLDAATKAPPFTVVDGCPAPTCQCQEMPPGLDIDQVTALHGSMAPYAEQVLISTGRTNWKSRIEDDGEGTLVAQLKGYLGRHGKYHDPYHNILLTNSSFEPTADSAPQDPAIEVSPSSAYLLPSFRYVPSVPTDPAHVDALIQAFVLPSQLHQSNDRPTRAETNILRRKEELQQRFAGVRDIDEVLVLVCGHAARDVRCGTLGPILQREFEDKLRRQNVEVLGRPPGSKDALGDLTVSEYVPKARVGQISHIGGHKFAGNVIVYIPPSFTSNALAGMGIWYGRVQPAHVEGIVSKTILEGKVIKELFRGGIDQHRNVLRL